MIHAFSNQYASRRRTPVLSVIFPMPKMDLEWSASGAVNQSVNEKLSYVLTVPQDLDTNFIGRKVNGQSSTS